MSCTRGCTGKLTKKKSGRLVYSTHSCANAKVDTIRTNDAVTSGIRGTASILRAGILTETPPRCTEFSVRRPLERGARLDVAACSSIWLLGAASGQRDE